LVDECPSSEKVDSFCDDGVTTAKINNQPAVINHLMTMYRQLIKDKIGYTAKYTSGRTGHVISPRYILSSKLIHDIITDEVKRLLVAYFNGAEPYLFYSSFLYTPAGTDAQALHRDINTPDFPVVTMLITIAKNGRVSTEVLRGSHKDKFPDYFIVCDDVKEWIASLIRGREDQLKPATTDTTHNAMLLDSSVLHNGVAVVEETYKLDLAFVRSPRTEVEKQMFIQHSYTFGIADVDKSRFGSSFPLFPLKWRS
jgi:hypothetical protein